jgi:hypothetical protein
MLFTWRRFCLLISSWSSDRESERNLSAHRLKSNFTHRPCVDANKHARICRKKNECRPLIVALIILSGDIYSMLWRCARSPNTTRSGQNQKICEHMSASRLDCSARSNSTPAPYVKSGDSNVWVYFGQSSRVMFYGRERCYAYRYRTASYTSQTIISGSESGLSLKCSTIVTSPFKGNCDLLLIQLFV